jgi:hypothetical protein
MSSQRARLQVSVDAIGQRRIGGRREARSRAGEDEEGRTEEPDNRPHAFASVEVWRSKVPLSRHEAFSGVLNSEIMGDPPLLWHFRQRAASSSQAQHHVTSGP